MLSTLAGHSGCLSFPGIGIDQRSDSTVGEPGDLLGVPEPGIGQRRLHLVRNSSLVELAVCLVEQRLECLPLVTPAITSAQITICSRVATAWAV
jgi:hypothetical protein